MNVTVKVDCTPEEARRFLGLPDLTPVHDAYVERMTKAVTDSTNPEAFGELMKNWGPMSETGFAMWRQLVDQMTPKK